MKHFEFQALFKTCGIRRTTQRHTHNIYICTQSHYLAQLVVLFLRHSMKRST